MIKKYRKKPVVIEAIQWTGDNSVTVAKFLKDATRRFHFDLEENFEGIEIYTLEGVMTANLYDYIIKGVHGEFYPCKPDIFEKTYEEVEND